LVKQKQFEEVMGARWVLYIVKGRKAISHFEVEIIFFVKADMLEKVLLAMC
jgi:hypothetical protein